jgi:hypothetical protein
MSGLDLMSIRLFMTPNKLHVLFVSLFRKLSHCAIRHPRLVLALVVAVTLASAPGILRLKLRTDGHALVSPDAPEVRYDKSIRNQFGIEDEIVVMIRAAHTNGIFNPATLQLVRDLTAAPDFIGGHIGVGGKIFERLLGEPRGIGSRKSAKNRCGEAGVIGQVARALPGSGGEGRALGELRLRSAGPFTKFAERSLADDSGIGRGQADAAPQIRLPVGRKM